MLSFSGSLLHHHCSLALCKECEFRVCQTSSIDYRVPRKLYSEFLFLSMTPETGNLLGKNIPPVNYIMIHPLLSEKVFVYHPFRDFRVPSADANREFQAPRIGFVLNFDYWNRKKISEQKNSEFFLPPHFPDLRRRSELGTLGRLGKGEVKKPCCSIPGPKSIQNVFRDFK